MDVPVNRVVARPAGETTPVTGEMGPVTRDVILDTPGKLVSRVRKDRLL